MENELPKGWVECGLGDICSKPQYGWTSKAGRTGKIKYIRTTDISSNNVDWDNVPFCIEEPADVKKYQVGRNDILVSRAGSVGLSFRIKEDLKYKAVFASYLIRFKAFDDITARLLEHFLNSKLYWDQILDFTAGVAIPNVNASKLEELSVPLPPLAEQQRIVTKLDTILARVNNCKTRLAKIPTLLKNFRQSVLAAAVSGELTKEWREKNTTIETAEQLINRIGKEREERYASAVKKAKESRTRKPTDFDNYEVSLRKEFDLFELPNTWQWADFRFIMSEDEAFCYGVVQPGTTDEIGNFLIRAGDIKNNTVETSELRTISKTIDEEYSRSRVHGGEILITVVGAGIGECGIVPISCKGYNIARAVAKVPIKDFNIKYILYWLNTSSAVNFMKGEAREVARPTLNLEQLRTIPIPLAPIEEQKEIVRKVEELFHFAQSIEARYQKAKAWFDKIPQAILAKAFKGQLVPQDENDEPASVLLERIKKEKQQATKPKTKTTSKTKKMYQENDSVSMVAEG